MQKKIATNAPRFLVDPYSRYVVAEQAEDLATTLVSLLEEALLYELVARTANTEAAQREANV